MKLTDFFASLMAESVRTRPIKGTRPLQFYELGEEQELVDLCYKFIREQEDYIGFKKEIFMYMSKVQSRLCRTPEFKELLCRLYPETQI